jgi:hypothetical protein
VRNNVFSRRLKIGIVAFGLGISPILGSIPPAAAQKQSSTDSLADVAKRLLSEIRGPRGAGSTGNDSTGNGNIATVSVPPVTVAPATVPPSTVGPNGETWSATVVDSDQAGAIGVVSPGAPPPSNQPPNQTDTGSSGAAAGSGSPQSDASGDNSRVDNSRVDNSRSALLHRLALLVSERTKVDALRLETVWLHTDDRRMSAVLVAISQVGTPYRYSGNQPGGFDCSGLTSYSWSQVGVKIPRTSSDQINAMLPRNFDQLLPGDLIWRPGHVGMYLGAGDAMVHSPQTGKSVEVRKIGNSSRYGSPLP